MAKTKIEWCDEVWNPVWGCNNGCRYCYARSIAKRFGRQVAAAHCRDRDNMYYGVRMENYEPTFLPWAIDAKFSKKSRIIFVNSMSDIGCWEHEWREKVAERIESDPDRLYVMLTKQPSVYGLMASLGQIPENLLCGVTLTGATDACGLMYDPTFTGLRRVNLLVNIEPLQERLSLSSYMKLGNFNVKWMIFGAETGTHKGKVVPQWEWYEDVLKWATGKGIPVFVKPSLKDITPDKYYLQQYPLDK